MNNVKETLIHDGTPLERLLLSSGRDERPSEDIERRLMAPLLVAPTQAPPPNGPGGAAAAAPTAAGVKWAVGTVSALSMAGVIGWMTLAPRLSGLDEHAPPTTQTAQPLLERAEQAPQRQSEPAPVIPPEPPRTETPARENELATPPPAPSPLRHRAASTLDNEMRLLDQAREALSAKDHTSALAILARYEQKYPKGILRPEATVLRVSALSAAGQASKADDLRKDFLDENPTSPHRRRLAEELPSLDAAQGSSPTTAH